MKKRKSRGVAGGLAGIMLVANCAIGNMGSVLAHAETEMLPEDDIIVCVSERQWEAVAAYDTETQSDMVSGTDAVNVQRRFAKPQHEKTGMSVSIEDCDGEWNFAVVGSMEGADAYNAAGSATMQMEDRIKVAIIDSGVDDTGDIDVYMRKNFIPGEDEVSILYEDGACHGTSVAGVIAALDNEEGITGINPNVLLYSARVLDSENRAPVSRVVEAIDWAIAQDVNIINLSFGTTVDSPALKAAIQRAYNADILLVAAAGNRGVVEYPAAYEEVIAVGAVNASGDHSEGSAVGAALELVAPGEQIVSTGSFGGICTVGGTSLAAPHVTAIASVLWQQDKSMPADFIRALLDFSANQYGDALEYGYGLVDLDFALSQYDSFKAVYEAEGVLEELIAEGVEAGSLEYNEKPVVEFDDVTYVEGLWLWANKDYGGHQFLLQEKDGAGEADLQGISGETMTTSGMKILKSAAIAPDLYFFEMRVGPEWHGYSGRTDTDQGNKVIYHSNYVFSYLFITQIASEVYGGTLPRSVVAPDVSCVSNCGLGGDCADRVVESIRGTFDAEGNLRDQQRRTGKDLLDWSELLSGNVTNRTKAIYIYGLALHSVTDMFAHSSYTLDGKHISHVTGTKGGADDNKVVPNRYECARAMCRYIISHVKKFQPGSIEDFFGVFSDTYDGTFKLKRLNKYIEVVDSVNYRKNPKLYDDATQN